MVDTVYGKRTYQKALITQLPEEIAVKFKKSGWNLNGDDAFRNMAIPGMTPYDQPKHKELLLPQHYKAGYSAFKGLKPFDEGPGKLHTFKDAWDTITKFADGPLVLRFDEKRRTSWMN